MEDLDRMNKKESSTIFKLAKSKPNKQIENRPIFPMIWRSYRFILSRIVEQGEMLR